MSQHYDTLRVTPSDDGYVVTVEMHRPEALNAMNTVMGRELLRCFEDFFWDKQTRVVILTPGGSSMSFSSRRRFASCAAPYPSLRRSKALPWAADVS